jgi:hypothetical protein
MQSVLRQPYSMMCTFTFSCARFFAACCVLQAAGGINSKSSRGKGGSDKAEMVNSDGSEFDSH